MTKQFYVVNYYKRNPEAVNPEEREEWISHLLCEDDHWAATRTAHRTCPDGFKMWCEPMHLGNIEQIERITQERGFIELLYT